MSILSIYDFKINFELLETSKSSKVYILKDKFYLSWTLNLVENKFEFLSESWYMEEEKRMLSYEYWSKISNPYVGNSLKFREEEKSRKMDSYKKNQEETKLFNSFFFIYGTFLKNIIYYQKAISSINLNFLKTESDLFFNNYKRKEKEVSSNIKQLNKRFFELLSYDKVSDISLGDFFYSYYFYQNYLDDEFFYENFKLFYKNNIVKNQELKDKNFNFFKKRKQKNFVSDWAVPKEYTLKEKGLIFFFKNSKKFLKFSFLNFLQYIKIKFIRIDTKSLYKEIMEYKDNSFLVKKLLYSIYLGNQKFDWKIYFYISNDPKVLDDISFLDDDDLLDMEDYEIEEISSLGYKQFYLKRLYLLYLGVMYQESFSEWTDDELKKFNMYTELVGNFFILPLHIKIQKLNFDKDLSFYINNIFSFYKKKNNFLTNYSSYYNNDKFFIQTLVELIKEEQFSLNFNQDLLKNLDFNQNFQKDLFFNSLDLMKEQGNTRKQVSYINFMRKYYSVLLTLKVFNDNKLVYSNNFKNLYGYYYIYNEIILDDFLKQRLNKYNISYENVDSYDLKTKLNKSDSKFFKYSLDVYSKVLKNDGSYYYKNTDSFYNNKLILFKLLSHLRGVLNIMKII